VNKKAAIPLGIGIAIIIVGIIVISNQESEISKSNEKITLENKTSEEPIINEKLNEIEKNADENYYVPPPREWITSGPFQIDRSKYVLGEKVFLRIGGLDVNEKGQIAFLKQTNETHYTVFQTIPFDGNNKNAFNYYTDIKLSKALGLCSIDDILGEWEVVFRGTNYSNIKFEIINSTLPGEEKIFSTPAC